MTPNIKGLGSALSKLKFDIETAVAPLVSDMENLGSDAIAEIKKAKNHVASVKAMKDDLAAFNKELEGSNGGPTLDDSKQSSETSGTEGEPGKSWAGEQAKTA